MYRRQIITITKIIIIVFFLALLTTIHRDVKRAEKTLVNSTFRPINLQLSLDMLEFMETKHKFIPNSSIMAFANDADTLICINLATKYIIIFESPIGTELGTNAIITNPKSWTTSQPYFMNQANLIYNYPQVKRGSTWEVGGDRNSRYKCGNRIAISLDQEHWNYVFTYNEERCFKVKKMITGNTLFTSIEILDVSDSTR